MNFKNSNIGEKEAKVRFQLNGWKKVGKEIPINF